MSENDDSHSVDNFTATENGYDMEQEAARAELRFLQAHLHKDGPLREEFQSTIRQEEPLAVLDRLENKRFLVVSGAQGIGKTSLLYQMSAEARARGQKAVVINKQALRRDDIEGQILRRITEQLTYGGEDLEQPKTIEEGIRRTKEHHGILLIDEFTSVIDDTKQFQEFEPLVRLIETSRLASIPTAIVVHAYPDTVEAATTLFHLDPEKQMYIPRDITIEEVHRIMQQGTTRKRGEQPHVQRSLQIDAQAAKRIFDYSGGKPSMAANIISKLYYALARSSTVPIVITRNIIDEQFDTMDTREFLQDEIPMIKRVSDTGLYLLEQSPEERFLFIDAFRLEPVDFSRSLHQNAQHITLQSTRPIQPALAEKWEHAGIIRENSGWEIDGAAINLYLSLRLFSKK